MTIPIQEDSDRILNERPGDTIYPKIKNQIEILNNLEDAYKGKIIEAVLRDMAFDLAVSNALDTISEIIAYIAQERGIEQPSFYGDLLMRNVSRISKLKASLDYAELLNLSGEERNLLIEAEIERLWEIGIKRKEKQKEKENINESKMIRLLEKISESLERKKPGRKKKEIE